MLDDIDRKIISFLQYDGRMPYTSIASVLGITEATVRRRVKQLTKRGKLQIVAIVQPRDLGWNEAAMIGITVKANRVNNVVNEISKLPEVTYLFQAAGEFDLFAEVYCKDRTHFISFLNDRLQQIPDIERTQSFMILQMHKLSYHWGESQPQKVDHQPPNMAD
jgi:Lrp/AsnC family transcriptional regulator for asnA, asnC and gidA